MKKGFLFTILLIAIFSIKMLGFGYLDNNPNYISGHWTIDDSPYYVDSSYTIHADSSLIIDPGVEVIFKTYGRLKVNGKLIAIGNQDEMISFHPSEDNEDGWNGIWFCNLEVGFPPKDSSILKYCNITGGTRDYPSLVEGGAITVYWQNELLIESCSITDNIADRGGAIFCYYCHPSFINNNISNNEAFDEGGAIYLEHSDGKICGNIIENNYGTDGGGGIRLIGSSPYIENNLFNNNSTHRSGGAISSSGSESVLINNIFSHNTAEDEGGALACYAANMIFINNTIVYNISNDPFTPCAIYSPNYSNSFFYNNIIYNNTPESQQIYVSNLLSQPEFKFNNIQGGYDNIGLFDEDFGIQVYENNINEDPLFLRPELNNFTLKSSSPCINKGSIDTSGLNIPSYDFYLNDRFYNRIDIGAFELGECTIPEKPQIVKDDIIHDFVNNKSYYSVEVQDSSKYFVWKLNPESAGFIESIDNTATIHWDPLSENVLVSVYAENNCGLSELADTSYYKSTINEIKNPKSVVEINLYPMPCDEFLNIKFEHSISKNYKIKIIDIKGRIIYKNNLLFENNLLINTSYFSKGIYLIRLIHNNEFIVRKFIKK